MSLAPSVHSLWPIYWHFSFFCPHEPSLQTIPKHLQLPGFPALPDPLPACRMSTHCEYLYPCKGELLSCALSTLSPSPLQFGSQLHSQGQAPALDLLFPSSGLSLWIPSPCVVYVCMYVGCGGGGWHRRSLHSPRGSSPLCCCVGTQHFRRRLIWAEDGSQAIMLARSTISTAGRRLLVHESWEWYCFRIPQSHPLQSLWDRHSR